MESFAAGVDGARGSDAPELQGTTRSVSTPAMRYTPSSARPVVMAFDPSSRWRFRNLQAVGASARVVTPQPEGWLRPSDRSPRRIRSDGATAPRHSYHERVTVPIRAAN